MARCPAILIAGRIEARASGWRDEMGATLETCASPRDDDRWDCFETREGPTGGQSANRACQLASSWSRDDHEDGGPTIQLPAAEPAAPFDLSAASSIRGEGRAIELPLFNESPRACVSSVQVVHFAARQSCYSPPHVAVIDVHSFGFTYSGAQRPAVRDVAFSVEPGEIFGFLGPSGSGLALVFTTWLFDRRLLRRG